MGEVVSLYGFFLVASICHNFKNWRRSKSYRVIREIRDMFAKNKGDIIWRERTNTPPAAHVAIDWTIILHVIDRFIRLSDE